MTAKDLFESDTTFRILIDQWVQDKRIPFPTADRLRDFGLWECADGAEWAYRQPDRKQFRPYYIVENYASGPYPHYNDSTKSKVYWFYDDNVEHANCITYRLYRYVRKYGNAAYGDFDSIHLALLALLDGYADLIRNGVALPNTVGVIQ